MKSKIYIFSIILISFIFTTCEKYNEDKNYQDEVEDYQIDGLIPTPFEAINQIPVVSISGYGAINVS